jgi:flagellar biosynthetic protein FliP
MREKNTTMARRNYKIGGSIWLLGLSVFVFWQLMAGAAYAQAPLLDISLGELTEGQSYSVALRLMILLTVLSLAPAGLVMLTSFTRIVVVLSFMRSSLATQQMPPNQVLIGLALFLTLFIMTPVFQVSYQDGIQPYMEGTISQEEAFTNTMAPIRDFMFSYTREKDLALFVRMADMERPRNFDDIPNHVLIPSFIISELKTAFQIGFVLFIPFLIIDMVVASILMSMGMMMLPPMMISLPFKLLLFVLVDGWSLLMQTLLMSFR